MTTFDKGKTPGGYERVKQILNDLQGNTVPDYQGYRAFWLDLDTLTSISIYGQRMIAPPLESGPYPNLTGHAPEGAKPTATGGGCCGGSSDDGAAVKAVNTQPTALGSGTDCWPSGGKGGAGASGEGIKRSDLSGLIKGLKGEYPFDGSIFPALLWDAERAATTEEIELIARWIDRGCPASEEAEKAASGPRIRLLTAEKQALACGDKKHSVSGKCTNVDKQQVQGLHVRKEVSTLTETELSRLRNALQCMYQFNAFWQDERSFDHWARIHTNSCQHGWEQFLPWHRLYLYFFEQTLQDYDPNITLPYWSWTDYADANATSFSNTEPDLGIIPEAYRCWLSADGLKTLKNTRNSKGNALFTEEEIQHLTEVQSAGTRYNSGLRFLNAAQIPYGLIKDPSTGTAAWSAKTRAIYDALRTTNPLWFPNRWPGSAGAPSRYPTKDDLNNIYDLTAWADFGGGPEYDHHFGALEQVHNGMHNFAGGVNPCYPTSQPANTQWLKVFEELGIATADPQNRENPPLGWMTDNRITAFDPIFWAHHANVDRVWAHWQELHPGANPEVLDGVLAPWSMSVKDSLSIKKLGYEYMRDSFHYATAADVAMTKFNSEKAGIRQSVLDNHRKAEIRLHRVQRGNMHNCTVRLFLNAPDANAATETIGNDQFVGEYSTFHGTCYGGPGHCNLPLSKTRGTDQRGLHHHEPRNVRLDATAAVQRQLAKGANDLSVHMVVVGAQGQPVDNALYIDGISLNFLD